ncbi:MAG: hypothetical protein WC328_14215 [Kiritimatiellia bacterium]|jgi:hypothetical protein|nr:hypothetical protein [Candidatus Saccharibacteria bacterium]
MKILNHIFVVSSCLICCASENGDIFSDYSVGVGVLVGKKADDKVEYDIKESLRGTLSVGEKITIQIQYNALTNKEYIFPEKALLILEPPLGIDPFSPIGTNIANRCFEGEYRALGGDVCRSVLQYTGQAQISNVLSNIRDYITSPTNRWLASHDAVKIAKDHVKNNPPASEYDSKTRYVLYGVPYRYRFGWNVLLSVENGFFGGAFCRVVVGDDKQVKDVSLY